LLLVPMSRLTRGSSDAGNPIQIYAACRVRPHVNVCRAADRHRVRLAIQSSVIHADRRRHMLTRANSLSSNWLCARWSEFPEISYQHQSPPL